MNVPRGSVLSARALRRIAIALLLLVPAVTLWNVYATAHVPRFVLALGPALRGVTQAREPAEWSLQAIADGRLQKSISDAIAEAVPVRPFLVRLSNSFRRRLFGLYGAPGVVAGADGQLIETGYIKEYCERDLAVLRERAASWLPRLRELQNYFESGNRQLVYFLSPSKAAYMPEKFVDFFPCPSRETDRREYLPSYRKMLEDAGVRYIDGAGMTHGLRGRYDVELFPLGGVHWNQLGVAHAADAILEQINRRAGREIAPRLQWTYEVTDRPTGTDTDLADVVNAMFGRPRYPVPKLTFADSKPCSEWPISRMNIALVGGSFVHDVARVLIAHGCMSGLRSHNYLVGGVRGGADYRVIRPQPTPDDLRSLADVDILLLEENEAGLPGMTHARRTAERILTPR